MSIRTDNEEWAEKRKEGFNNYFISQLAEWVKKSIKLYLFFVLVFFVIDLIENGFDPRFIPEILKIVILLPAVFIIFSPLFVYSSWREREKKYKQFLQEEQKLDTKAAQPIEDIENIFPDYKMIKILAYSVLILPPASIILFTLGSLLEYEYNILLTGIPFLAAVIIIKILTSYFKNPICGHSIFSVDEQKRHTDAEGSWLDNVLQIIKKNKFDCLECNTKYSVYSRNGIHHIAKR
jgi:hypothetical protein